MAEQNGIKLFFFLVLEENQECFPCILIKGDVNKEGIDQCVTGSNLFKFDGFTTPDLIKDMSRSDDEKKENKKKE